MYEYNHEWGGSTYGGSSKQSESSSKPADQRDLQPKVVINEDVYQKVMYWIKKAPGEVSGMGKVIFDPIKNEFRVVTAYLLKQKNTGSSTEIDAADIGKLLFQTRNDPGELRWWWHSHVNFGTFWSTTDMTTIRELGGQGWILATVLNKKEDRLSAFCQAAPCFLFVDKLDTSIDRRLDTELEKRWAEEYDTKCEVVQYVSQYSNNNKSSGNRNMNDTIKVIVGRDIVEVSREDLVAYAEAFGAENIPQDVLEVLEENDVQLLDDDTVEQLKKQGYTFEDEPADEDVEQQQEQRKLDLGPVQKKSWKNFINGRRS